MGQVVVTVRGSCCCGCWISHCRHYSPITRVEAPVLVKAGARDGVSPAPIAITPGRDAMIRFWVCWLSVCGLCSRLCRAVRVLTGGRVPPGAETCGKGEP